MYENAKSYTCTKLQKPSSSKTLPCHLEWRRCSCHRRPLVRTAPAAQAQIPIARGVLGWACTAAYGSCGAIASTLLKDERLVLIWSASTVSRRLDLHHAGAIFLQPVLALQTSRWLLLLRWIGGPGAPKIRRHHGLRCRHPGRRQPHPGAMEAAVHSPLAAIRSTGQFGL